MSIDVSKKKQVEPVTAPGHCICSEYIVYIISVKLQTLIIVLFIVPKYLEDGYLRMTTKFAIILKHFVIQIFKEKEKLKDVQIFGLAHA